MRRNTADDALTVRELVEKLQQCPQDSKVTADIVDDADVVWDVLMIRRDEASGRVYLLCGWDKNSVSLLDPITGLPRESGPVNEIHLE